MENSLSARAKILYLITLSCVLFFIDSMLFIILAASFQTCLYILTDLPFNNLFQACRRLLLLALIIVISFLLFPQSKDAIPTQWITQWFTLNLYFGELQYAAVMLTRIYTLLAASIWVRDSCQSAAFIDAMRWLRLPEIIAIAIDAGLSLASQRKGNGNGNGGNKKHNKGAGKHRGNMKKKISVSFSQIKSGNLSFVDDLIHNAYKQTALFLETNYSSYLNAEKKHDVSIILTVVIAAMSLKLLQLLPGLPIAPGHKNLIIVPLIVIATLACKTRWGGFYAGLAIGIVSFMMGYGKFGILEIAHFAFPGFIADLLAPKILAGNMRLMLLRFGLLGAIIGVARFAANFLIIILAGAPTLAWALFTPMLISQSVFGALSALIGVYIVNKIKQGSLFEQPNKTE